MKPVLSEVQLQAWRSLYGAFWRVFAAVEADLEAAKLPSLSWYDALYELHQAPDHHLRMSELAQCAQLSRSAATRLVDKLERAGLIARKSCPSDGRVQHAQLTPAGAEMLRRIWPVYRAGIARHFARQLSEAEARQLASILTRLRSES